MPVKAVPGGYRIIPQRKDPGARRTKREFRDQEQYQTMMSGGEGGPALLQMPDPGVSGADPTVAPPSSSLGSARASDPASVAKAGTATQRARSLPPRRPPPRGGGR